MAVDQICASLGPFLTAALMKKDPWIAFAVGVSLHVLSIPVTLFIPETLSKRHCAKTSSSRRTSSSQHEPSALTSMETSSSFTKAIKSGLVSLKQYIRILCYDWRVITLSCVYVNPPFLCVLSSATTMLTSDSILAFPYGHRPS